MRDELEAEREALAAKARAMIDRVEKSRATYQGPCRQCRWCESEFLGDEYRDECHNPIVRTAAFGISDHYHRERSVRCTEQRDSRSIYGEVFCGPNGMLFEKKAPFLARLFGAE